MYNRSYNSNGDMMRKILIIIILIFIIITIVKIDITKKDSKQEIALAKQMTINQQEKRAIFVSYIENSKYLKNKNGADAKDNILKMLNNIANDGFNMLIFHVRSSSDSIYNSAIFPSSNYVVDMEGDPLPFDILQYVIEEAHARGIEVHAWINPYRIRTTTDISTISNSNPAYKWLNTSNVKVVEGKGIFYNPASEEVQNLITEGVKEIVKNYQVDGIFFDDYFYPDKEIDLTNYLDYQNEGGKLTLDAYRLDNVNKLVKKVYSTIKKENKSVLFGIGPEGNIDNNYEENYADTKKWVSEEGYIDYIMPQVYFGFENQNKPYIETVTMWNDLITNPHVKLYVALAFYKVGLPDEFALSGADEWLEHDDIIKKEILVGRNLSNYQGFALFRYDYFFDPTLYTDTTIKEIENVKQIIFDKDA